MGWMTNAVTACAIAIGSGLLAAPALASDVTGTWLTESGTSRVRIAHCGAGRCGTIVWTKKAGLLDEKNPDPVARTRPVVGLRMIVDAKPDGEGWTGQLYNPLEGKTYTGKVRLKSPNALELSGCVFGGLICKSQTWSRVE